MELKELQDRIVSKQYWLIPILKPSAANLTDKKVKTPTDALFLAFQPES